MKKFLILVILALAIAGPLAAAGQVIFKGGLSKATLISGYADKSLTGFQLGVGYEFALSSRLSFSPELAFVRRGTAEGLPQLGSLVTAHITYDFLELPLLIRWRLGKNSTGFHPLLFAGLYGAYAVSMRSEISASGQSWTEDLSSDSRRLDWGLLSGAGFEFPLFGRTFVFEGRFHYGLAKLNKVAYPQPWKSSSLSLLLGLKL
jgi:hypothetical protein